MNLILQQDGKCLPVPCSLAGMHCAASCPEKCVPLSFSIFCWQGGDELSAGNKQTPRLRSPLQYSCSTWRLPQQKYLPLISWDCHLFALELKSSSWPTFAKAVWWSLYKDWNVSTRGELRVPRAPGNTVLSDPSPAGKRAGVRCAR